MKVTQYQHVLAIYMYASFLSFFSQKFVSNVCMYHFVFVYGLILYNYLREGLDMRTVLKCTFFYNRVFIILRCANVIDRKR